jgi:hypothetical protein
VLTKEERRKVAAPGERRKRKQRPGKRQRTGRR